MYDTFIKGKESRLVHTHLEGEAELLKSDTTVFFGPEMSFTLAAKEYPCTIQGSSMAYHKTPVAMAFTMNSPYLEVFSDRLRRIQQAGLWQRVWDNYHTGKDACSPESNKPIGYQNLVSAYLILLLGAVVSGIVVGIESLSTATRDKHVKNAKSGIKIF